MNNIGNAGHDPICYNSGTMFELLRLWFGVVLRIFHMRRCLMLENLALRQQLAVLKRGILNRDSAIRQAVLGVGAPILV